MAGATGVVAPIRNAGATAESTADCACACDRISLEGIWRFRFDKEKVGEVQGWQDGAASGPEWSEVRIPHTWQIDAGSAAYFGTAWYRRAFDAPASWKTMAVRIEFEAVYHTATVWLNGHKVGEHLRKGYTAFACDLSSALHPDGENVVVVRVENDFDQNMLPRGTSFDWTPDGGITRPVRLLITPRTYIAAMAVDADPDLTDGSADALVNCRLHNTDGLAVDVALTCRVVEEGSGLTVARQAQATEFHLAAGEARDVSLPGIRLPKARLWHFDHPQLYRMHLDLFQGGRQLHSLETDFGVRRFEVRGSGFYLNGERVWLMGVERMAGSHPDFGMAEPLSLIEHDHRDMSELNCVFTRVHWQQDRRVLDYCDRHGILIQVEVPTWGPDTFKGMQGEPAVEIMGNALEQLQEMIERDRNHPSIIAWGLCNEIGGQNPVAYDFAKRLYNQAKTLDPRRLRTYASNSLQKDPGKDVAGLMDFIEWNEYYESWYGGTVERMRENLAEIHSAFPDKPIVISEYGYCECAADRKPGDALRVSVLRRHNEIYREFDWVGGAVFFCYNDYRTHIGDKGNGPLKQRVHGVVDLYGGRKPSFAVLRRESSPLERLEAKREGTEVVVTMQSRRRLPAYVIVGYRLRWIVHGYEDLPMEQGEVALPVLEPGTEFSARFSPKERNFRHIQVDVLRPTGFSVSTAELRETRQRGRS